MSDTEAPPQSLVDFLNARRRAPWSDYPWDGMPETGSVPAAPLYEAYKAEMEAADRAVLSHVAFGGAVMALGFQRSRTNEGHFYSGLFDIDMTREKLARRIVRALLRVAAFERFERDEVAAHLSAVEHDGPCAHKMSEMVRAELGEQAEAYMVTCEDDGTLARAVEEEYGPYLHWQEGDPHPWLALTIARLEASIPALEADLVAARTAHERHSMAATQAWWDWRIAIEQEQRDWPIDEGELGVMSWSYRQRPGDWPYNWRNPSPSDLLYAHWKELEDRPVRPGYGDNNALTTARLRVEAAESDLAGVLARLASYRSKPEPTTPSLPEPEPEATTSERWS